MRIETAHIHELGDVEIARWRALQERAGGALGSPFLTPEYAQIIARARPDARVAIIESDGCIEGFLAVQRPAGAAAMPLGAPISDYQGLIGPADLDVTLPDLCRALEVGRLDFNQAPAEQNAFATSARGTVATWLADLRPGKDAYFAGVKSRHGPFLYQLSRTRRKLVRERGEVEFTAQALSLDHFNTLLRWKEAQLARTRQPAVWRAKWVREAMDSFRTQEGEHFSGVLFTLTLGDRLVAANFCLRSKEVLHGLLMAHDHEFDPYSPGLQLVRHVLEWAAERGVCEVDFGVGEQLYKRQFGTDRRAVVWGWAGTRSLASWSRSLQYALRQQIERVPHPWIASLPGRAMRRLDVYRGLMTPLG